MEAYWTKLSELSPIERLDTVLSYMATSNVVIDGVTLIRLDGLLKDKGIELSKFHPNSYSKHIWADSQKQLEKILGRLEKDGYVRAEVERVSLMGGQFFDGEKKYYVTFDGEVFNQKGGYKRQTRKETTTTSLANLQKWILMVGGFLAGIYSLIQIVRVSSRGFRGQIRKVFAIEVLSALIFLIVGLLLGTVIVLLIVEAKERRSKIQDKRQDGVHKDDA